MPRTQRAFPYLMLGSTLLAGCGYLGSSSVDEAIPPVEREGGSSSGSAAGMSSGGADPGWGGQAPASGGAPIENDGACARGCTRAGDSLLALYTFQVGAGQRVLDRSALVPALDLALPEAADVTWLPSGLRLNTATLMRSVEPAKKLVEPILLSQEVSLELWITPANLDQDGPARLVSVAVDEWHANLMLGLEGTSLRGRIRTDERGVDGIPELEGPGNITLERQHVVYTRDALGREKLYRNSDLVHEDLVGGRIEAWDLSYFLSLGAQVNTELLSRDFVGTYHLVAIYSRALEEDIIRKNYVADGGRLEEQP